MKHDAAKEEVLQKGNFWHFGNAFSCSAGSESSMTFSPSLPKFDRMTQGEGIPMNLKVKGVLCTGLSQSQHWGIVYSWELLQLPAGLLKSLWMKKEPALHMGWGIARHLSGYQGTERRKQSCQLSRIKMNWELVVSPLKSPITWSFISHLCCLKKKQHTTQNSSCWLKPRHFACLQTKVFICPPSQLHSTAVLSTQCFNLTVPFLTQRGWAAERQGFSPLEQNSVFLSLCSLITRPKHLCSKHSPGDHFALHSKKPLMFYYSGGHEQ